MVETYFQAVKLVAAPNYPNAIAWSDENLIAVASGTLVTILNPTSPFGARGTITIPASDPLRIGLIERKDLFSDCLLTTCLSRDDQPRAQSIAWSPIGMAPNAGCLLAVCTSEGCVKLYRPPFCDFSAEWIEIMDISNKLYDYLESIKYGEVDVLSSKCSDIPVKEGGSAVGVLEHFTKENSKRKKKDELNSNNESRLNRALEKSKEKRPRRRTEDSSVPSLISAQQYASRSAMLLSLVIAWSPVIKPSHKVHSHQNSSVSVLAVGTKSGKVSFWKVNVPECYSPAECMVPTRVLLVGILQAHNSWINCISWMLFDSDSSNPKVLLATGSTDGSVRIWQCYCEELLASSDSNFASFSLLKEVISGEGMPTLLSLYAPNLPVHKLFLAIGRGSGSLEIRIFNLSSCEFDNVRLYDAHDHVVTGVAWAFDGRYLFTCSEDNILRGWSLDESSLREIPISSRIPGLGGSIDLADTFRSCFGIAVSPGNLVAAVVRNFDLESLDRMYEARSQKAAVQFFWIGGEEIEVMPNSSYFYNENFPDISKKEFVNWESSMLWSLNQFKNLNKPMVVWDVVAALLAFRQSIPEYVDHILLKWLSTSYLQWNKELSATKILPHVSKNVSTFSTRQLHLLNIICRRVVLSELIQDQVNNDLQSLEILNDAENEKHILWKELLLSSERELRQRLIGLCFACSKLRSLSTTEYQPGFWYPIGLAEMQQWIRYNREHLHESVKVIASKAGKNRWSKHSAMEQCTYCSAAVPFESPELGFCQGVKRNTGVGQSHKLVRCSVSMQVCPATAPLWFCMCCSRSAFRLAPDILFQMSETPDFSSLTLSDSEIPSKPLCPFCGILLQRRQPDFLLSACPV